MKIITKKKFAKAVLDEYIEIFVMHIIFLLTMAIYLARKVQIILLITKKV